jgi:hypothetical protein
MIAFLGWLTLSFLVVMGVFVGLTLLTGKDW